MIPDFQSMMLPLLRTLEDGRNWSNREVSQQLSREFQLSSSDLGIKLKSGASSFTNRIAWAKAHLKRAGLLESPICGEVRITSTGIHVLADNPTRIDIPFLKQFDGYRWNRRSNHDGNHDEQPTDAIDVGESEATPEETLEAAYFALREALADEILERVKACTPEFFEELVVELLVAMGYGGSLADAGHRLGRAGDGGIDGIIKEDKLGLDVVCIQAKRWEGTVGRPVVQSFAGSMEGSRARKGVLITTGSFSKDAHDYVKQIERKIVLIDGVQLAQYMIDHNVGVVAGQAYTIKRIDSDYFMGGEI